ncbi:MAG TPA: formimidoylglutamase [Candidatus Binatia bacterium]|nr:formimidoylglutamase [Candidatus Binatia bacterium]
MSRLPGVRAADAALFFTRNDPADPRLGERVRDTAYDAAQVVLLGCPQDEGVRRNGGRAGTAQAPAEIRRWLYRLTTAGLDGIALCDAGDTVPLGTLEETHSAHEHAVARILADGKRVVVLGGGNDLSYPDCAALARQAGPVAAFNVDAHLDVRADRPRNSGTPYRQLIEEKLLEPRRFCELAIQPQVNSPVYLRWLREQGGTLVTLDRLRARGVAAAAGHALARAADAASVFWGFDLDAVRASDAPGVSAPNPLGLTGEELCELAALAGAEPRTRIVEFTEVNPAFDLDGRTSRLAAVAIHRFLSALAAA